MILKKLTQIAFGTVNNLLYYLKNGTWTPLPTGGGGSTSLQQVLDAGAVLNKSNIIDSGGFDIILNSQTAYVSLVSGDYTGVNSNGQVYTDPLNVYLYAQDDSNVNDTTLTVSPTSATIQKKGGAAKNIATIAVADNFVNDAAAATGGIAVGSLYHTAGAVKVRLT